MTEEQIKAEMRLWVLEVLVCQLFVLSFLQTEDPLGLATRAGEKMRVAARDRTFPQVDAAMSDLLSAKLESASTWLMGMGIRQITRVLERRQGR
jgi:hypothetical protein